MVRIFTLLLFLISSGFIFAQKGIIRGTVIEGSTGEPLYGATVVIKGTSNGTISDFDGKFDIKADPGTYDIDISFVSFATVTITGIVVTEGEVTVIDQVTLQEDVVVLGEGVTITAAQINTTEEALLTLKRKSVNVLDGISAANFKKIGDSDAGAAAKRVTGVSVEGGKYVFVRGLGDRYTKTTLNGLDIPSLDPDRNSIQIDIFPTALIDNLVINKSFTPELPADFTGGLVNIETKDFPDERIFDVSASIGINPSMHFRSDYITYQGSSTDFLGFDNGQRRIPSILANTPDLSTATSFNSDQEVRDFFGEFDPTLGPEQRTSAPNFSFGLTYGDQKELANGNKLGYLFSVTYKNNTRFFDDVSFGEFQLDNNPDSLELIVVRDRTGLLGEREVLLGGLTGIAYKTDNSKFKLNLLHLQNGITRSAQLDLFENGDAPIASGFVGISNNLEYNQRGVSSAFLSGEHYLNDGDWNIDWISSVTYSTQDDPDIRRAPFDINNSGDFVFNAGGTGNVQRLWRELEEINISGKVDVTREFEWFGQGAKLKFGVSHAFKERDFSIISINLVGGTPPQGLSGDPNDIFTPENLAPDGNLNLVSSLGDPNPNEFNASSNNTGFYGSVEFSPFSNLKTILGVRGENFTLRHTGLSNNNNAAQVLNDSLVLDGLDFFPSVNFIYSITEKQNLRVSYSRTIARPSFKEQSFIQIIDPVSDRTFNGGLFPTPQEQSSGVNVAPLVETFIDNVDIRWELYQERGQLFSVSGFYKSFQDPIELVRLFSASAQFQPQNVGDARVLGFEIEVRKSLEFLGEQFSNWNINGNFTFVDSQVDISEEELGIRQGAARTGQVISETRDQLGQAPYIVNVGLSYNDPSIGLDAGLFYNVQGETLSLVVGPSFPDVFNVPFNSLNFNANKTFGEEQRISVNLSVTNILDDVREQVFQSFGATDQNFKRFSPGREIGIGFSYSF